MRLPRSLVAGLVLMPLFAIGSRAQEPGVAASLAGTWVGDVVHAGSRTSIALTFRPDSAGALQTTLFIPVIHVRDVALGRLRREGTTVAAGPFSLTWDSAGGTLEGVLPAAIVPVHEIPVKLRRGEMPPFPARPRPAGPAPTLAWMVELGAPVWTDPVVAGDLALIGTVDGRVHARDVRTGAPRWVFTADGPVRAPAVVDGETVYVHADDGYLYRLDRATGAETWKVRTTEQPIVRVPPPGPNSRWDTHASGVALADGRLYVGTHDGQILALDTADGSRQWGFITGGSILATPAVADGRVFAGSYDGQVYAFDAATGTLLWAFDTHAPVTSTPVPWNGVVVAGSRSYDVFGLDAATGTELWNRYVWFSWIESTPAIRNGIAYVGSSDAGKIMAIDVASGGARWDADVLGASWGTPAVADRVLYVATRGQAGAFTHSAGVLALDRATGRILWRFRFPTPGGAAFSGVAGSPALGAGRLLVAAVDGRVYAFDISGGR